MNGRTLTLICFVAISLLPGTVPAEEVTVHRDLIFAEVGETTLQLDLFLPDDIAATDRRPPLVVWIHGGGWRGGSRKTPPIRWVTEHGYALASISYRFTDKAVFPAQIHDCKAAIRWLRAHANKYSYNSKWIAVAGSSAGGHLALMLGVSGKVTELEGTVGKFLDHSSSVQAVVDYFGPSDFVLRGKTQPERAYTEKSGSFALLGGKQTGKLTPEVERFGSPANYVSRRDPPLLVFHGDKDEVVLLDQSERILQLYRERELQAQLVVIAGAGHGGKEFFAGENREKVLRFLQDARESRGE